MADLWPPVIDPQETRFVSERQRDAWRVIRAYEWQMRAIRLCCLLGAAFFAAMTAFAFFDTTDGYDVLLGVLGVLGFIVTVGGIRR